MSATLYPLVYNSGIQRDGTSFQGDYCLDSQWIRFQRDKIKKIGGMKGVNPLNPLEKITLLKIVPAPDRNEIVVFVGHNSGILQISLDSEWNVSGQVEILPGLARNNEYMWESEIVVDTGAVGAKKTYIVFMLTSNGTNISQNIGSKFFKKEISPILNNSPVEEFTASLGLPVEALNTLSGNLCFASPYLFLFGSNGAVYFSNSNNPFVFSNTNFFAAAADKVVYGRAIRGGPNSPSLLLWTLSSVVRVTNTGTSIADGTPLFKPEIISMGSSVLSSKCVVEYDGFFFWPGTDRFFAYNGNVDELPNRQNLNYFYNNLDLTRRQQVFGVKNAKYGEMWWFYPVKGVAGNSRAIVFNKRENFWYDTEISREAGTFSNNFGFMATYGLPINPTVNENYLWRHEFNTRQQRVVNGTAQPDEEIISSFITPIFSWVAFPPRLSKTSQASQLINRWIDLQRIEPDFVDTDGVSTLSVEVLSQEYAQSKLSPITNQVNFTSSDPKIDIRAQGRNLALKFTSSDKFEVGRIMLLVGLGDAR